MEPRDAARLLVAGATGAALRHARVHDLAELCEPGDLLVINDTKVLPARLALERPSGGAIEVLLLEEVAPRTWECLLRPSRRVALGDRLEGPVGLRVVASLGEGRWQVCFEGDEAVLELLARHGTIPLPPYITTPLADTSRYQTVYARRPASAAAPTAGLHLTDDVFASLEAAGVAVARLELVVGLGTFRPITTAQVEDHVMHHENYRIPAQTLAALAQAKRVVAVGTTVVRSLEAWAATGEASGRTDLFLSRGHRFAVVDRLLTNFHVPRSSLLVLLDAFIGPSWRALYDVALAENYRFLSLGDAMLVDGAHRVGDTATPC